MSCAKDLVGKRFGRLTVISRNYEKQKELLEQGKGNKAYWNCLCDCGKQTVVCSSNLQNKINPTTSCGCYLKEIIHKQKNTKSNRWMFDGNTAIGITDKGERFFIDIDDYEIASQYCWRFSEQGYIIANGRNGENKIVWLHRVVMRITDDNTLVDHKDWDKHNNRKSNLRIATKSENNINIRRKRNNTSGYTGVTFNKRCGKYVARISKDNKRIFLGAFSTFEEAVKARHSAELELHGEWSGENNRNDYSQIINR
jgi:hypothetical protein